jgi:D-alanyl-D-alanine carboxypeptidase
MTRSLVVALVSMAVFSGCGGSPNPGDTRLKASGLKPQLARTLHDTLARTARDLGVPGAAAAIVFADGSAWAGATGVAVLKPRAEVTAATAFGYRSITKTFFAALTLRLAERGRLRLDDRVLKWVPSWRGDRDATVRDLLRHTAGTRDLPDRAWARILAHPRARWTPTRVLALAPRPSRRSSAPEYSNVDYNLLGLVDARAAGTPAATALRHEVLAPLGLRRIAYAAEGPVPEPVATGYVYPHGLSDPRVAATDGGHRLTAIDTVMGTAGALYGSAETLARFGQLLFGGRLLKPASLGEMVRFEPFSGGPWDSYGIGVAHQEIDGHEVWGHDGDGFGMHGELWHLPHEHLTLVTLWNDDAIKDPTLPRALLRAALGERH